MTALPTIVDWTDFFCGAGGSSTGIKKAHPQVEVRQALNHWAKALETHERNHPTTEHYLSDVSASEPHWVPRTRCAWFSPECRYNSSARGKREHRAQLKLFETGAMDPSERRSRATAEDVLRFTACHRYDVVIVENVVEFRSKWEGFEGWHRDLQNLGYETQAVYLNSMFCHPTPQSRDRLYIVAWKRGMRRPDLDFRPPAFCAGCGEDVESVQSWRNPKKPYGKYKQQYDYRCPRCAQVVTPYYYCAANLIDWSLPAQRIGDRKKPLKPKTIERIEIGLKKFSREPYLVSTNYFRDNYGLDQPYPTQTTNGQYGIAVPPFLMDQGNSYGEAKLRDVSDPIFTQTTRQTVGLVVPPFLVETAYPEGDDRRQRTLQEPCPSQTTQQTVGLITPPFFTGYYGTDQGHQLQDPLPTVTTKDRCGLVVPPPFLMGIHTATSYRQMWDALQTVVAEGNHHFMVEPGTSIRVEDCGFRMLQPHEIKVAMGFPRGYTILGNNKEQVKQSGNAVTPETACWLVLRVLAILD